MDILQQPGYVCFMYRANNTKYIKSSSVERLNVIIYVALRIKEVSNRIYNVIYTSLYTHRYSHKARMKHFISEFRMNVRYVYVMKSWMKGVFCWLLCLRCFVVSKVLESLRYTQTPSGHITRENLDLRCGTKHCCECAYCPY